MKETTTAQVPATTRKTTKACDICGNATDSDRYITSPSVFASPVRIESEVVTLGLAHRRVTEAWDFCPPCFDQKVRPLLETIAKARKVEESW